MTAQTIPFTVVIPVKDEEVNLEKCLQRLSLCDDVIVIDSGSQDMTQEIALRYNAKLLQFKWDGRYPKKRNWFLLNHKPKYNWVLFLDADEFVSEAFLEEATAAVLSGPHQGYWLNYTNYFLGKRLKYGVPQRKLSLFRVGSGFYEKIEEESWSRLDMEIHEHPIIEGSLGEISSPVDHNDDRGIEKFVYRHLDYAKWEVARLKKLADAAETKCEKLTWRQRTKYSLLGNPFFPILYFFYQWIIKFGILDGYAGYQYAVHKFWYFNLIGILSRPKG